MSGGHFDYQQSIIGEISYSIKKDIACNDIEDSWGYKSGYSSETLSEFKKATELLDLAKIYVQRIDWLMSGDDSEETFHERLQDELKKHGEQK